ncbi:hypothetical protein ACFPVY_01915 [Flavobacterium qiangtangense]|uniref:Uncharacterized protein n=1 Tax=Flavobacterium qiangtangense TaxID=1442595 RepID=A0ABW1PJZ3_9FLAO
MKPISALTSSSQDNLENGTVLLEKAFGCYPLQILFDGFCLWLVAIWPDGGRMAFRAGLFNTEKLQLKSQRETTDGIQIALEGKTGSTKINLNFPDPAKPIFHYTASFTPAFDLLPPNAARDIMPLFKGQGRTQNTSGRIHASQIGLRSGLLFFTLEQPKSGSVFYFQNLTALNPFCEATGTSAGDLVGGSWPEIGLKLPETSSGKPLKKDKEYVISDAYVCLSDAVPSDNYEISRLYLDSLAAVYRLLPIPETKYHDWPDILKRGLDGLSNHKGCWKFADGRSYLNAYVSDYKTPPESMVQLAVLLPLTDFDEWSGEDHSPIIEALHNGLENFYDPQLGTIVRWLPALEKNLDWSEEQKEPGVMDSWYLHHPLLNLSRLALKGDANAKKLLLDSLPYTIKVARHFSYEWPVFYNMATLEVLKAETAPGKGGEKDVPGAYAHLMLQAWKLTGNKTYLEEACRAAKKLDGLGLDVFYQANNTAFSAGALLSLYKETKDKIFLDLSHLCIAAILNNVQLWECNYGNARHYPTFFAVYPLKDAPYTAAYEEQEVFAALHEFLIEADSVDEVLPSVKMLLAECLRHIINRVAYYYPPMLPNEVIADKEDVKTGEIDPNLWIALEDLQDGWNRSGQVGQEVYGAGVAFGIVPRQYHRVDEANLMVFTDYPAANFRKSGNTLTFQLQGGSEMQCRMATVPIKKDKPIPKLTVAAGQSSKKRMPVHALATAKGAFKEYILNGCSSIKIEW